MNRFREGDIVNVRAVVLCDYGGEHRVKLHCGGDDMYSTFRAPRADVTLERAKFAIGDVVDFTPTGRDYDARGLVIAVAGDELWIEWKTDGAVVLRETHYADNVDRVSNDAPDAEKSKGEAA